MKIVSLEPYVCTYGLTKNVFVNGYNVVWRRVGNSVHSQVKAQVVQHVRRTLEDHTERRRP